MKKILTFALLLFSLFTLVACDNKVLDTPVVTVSTTGLASWNAVENAAGYIYKINDGDERVTYKTKIMLKLGESIVVKAWGNGGDYSDSDYSSSVQFLGDSEVFSNGIPMPKTGYYMKDAEVLQDDDARYLVYTTNKTEYEEDNIIVICKGEETVDGWEYGAPVTVLEPSEEGWDQYLGSASVTQGIFNLNGETYNYLMAYQASDEYECLASSIGLAVAKEIQGEWIKVGDEPIIEYNASEYGATMAGCYSPSVINYDRQSGIRIFFTHADKFGHFTYFWDADLSDLSNIVGYKAVLTVHGAVADGGNVTMFPNADFAYDSINNVFYAAKDYYPLSAMIPKLSERFQVLHIAEEELYTTDKLTGWVDDFLLDDIDLELELNYERAYSPCIVSDMYGHMLDDSIEIVYNNCKVGDDYLYSQRFLSYIN